MFAVFAASFFPFKLAQKTTNGEQKMKKNTLILALTLVLTMATTLFAGDTNGGNFCGDTNGGNFCGDTNGGNLSGDTNGGNIVAAIVNAILSVRP